MNGSYKCMFFTDIHDLKSAERLTGIPQTLLRYYIRTGRLPTKRMGNAYVMEQDKLVDFAVRWRAGEFKRGRKATK